MLDDIAMLRRLVTDLIKCINYYIDKVNKLEKENAELRRRSQCSIKLF